jgi:hypothetical protein
LDFLFPVSGVETPLWLPPLIALVIVLGFDTPAVTPTNVAARYITGFLLR